LEGGNPGRAFPRARRSRPLPGLPPHPRTAGEQRLRCRCRRWRSMVREVELGRRAPTTTDTGNRRPAEAVPACATFGADQAVGARPGDVTVRSCPRCSVEIPAQRHLRATPWACRDTLSQSRFGSSMTRPIHVTRRSVG
jgi:hypothetical protein